LEIEMDTTKVVHDTAVAVQRSGGHAVLWSVLIAIVVVAIAGAILWPRLFPRDPNRVV
jgi:cytochrome b subunit of formate dehydrogenase